MASDTYIKFDGVEGESLQADHKTWVEVLSWSWGVSATTTVAKVGGGTAVGKPVPNDITITHQYDKASPVLAKKIVTGTHFPTVTLSACKTVGEGQKEYLSITMKSVYITSVSMSGGSDGAVLENVTMVFNNIDFAYKPQDAKGALGADIKFGWDVSSGKAT